MCTRGADLGRGALRLAALELRTGLSSPWYYLFVGLFALFVALSYRLYPARDRLAVVLTGGLDARKLERVGAALSREGYEVEREADPARAIDRLARDRALAVLRVGASGALEAHLRSFILRPDAEAALRIAALRAERDAFEAAARRAGAPPGPSISVERRTSKRTLETAALSFDLAGTAARSLWPIAATWSYALSVLTRGSFARIRRDLRPLEIVLGKSASGLVFMLPAGVPAFLVPLALGLSYPRPWAILLPIVAAALAGTAIGTFFALLALTRPPREERSLIAGCAAIVIIYTVSDAAAGGFLGEIPEGALAPLNLSWQLQDLTRQALFLSSEPLLPGILRPLALIALAAALAIGAALLVVRAR